MPNYRRWRDGRTYFFTVVTYGRRRILCLDPCRAALRASIAATRADLPFVVEAWVLLPDHLHCIWTLPPGDADYSTRWGKIKAGFTRRIAGLVPELGAVSASRRKHREKAVWQRRFWEHTIRDERDFRLHFDYLHHNPVKHGVVATPLEWPWSTLHRFVQTVAPPSNQAGDPDT